MAGCSGRSVYLINIKIHLRKRGWIQSVRKRESWEEREGWLWFQTTCSITLIPAQPRWLQLLWWIFTLWFIFIYISRQVIVTDCSPSFRVENFHNYGNNIHIKIQSNFSCIPNHKNLAMPMLQFPPTPGPNTTPNFNHFMPRSKVCWTSCRLISIRLEAVHAAWSSTNFAWLETMPHRHSVLTTVKILFM